MEQTSFTTIDFWPSGGRISKRWTRLVIKRKLLWRPRISPIQERFPTAEKCMSPQFNVNSQTFWIFIIWNISQYEKPPERNTLETIIWWLQSCLSELTQIMSGNSITKWVPIALCVSQGSVLEPLLFILFSADTTSLIPLHSATGHLFVDGLQA